MFISGKVSDLINRHKFDLGFDDVERAKPEHIKVGEYFINSYWEKTFQILNLDGHRMTVLWVDDDEITTHCTPISKNDYHIVLAKKR